MRIEIILNQNFKNGGGKFQNGRGKLAYLKHMTFVLDFIKCWMRLRHRDIQ
jgi:hypothetical protein